MSAERTPDLRRRALWGLIALPAGLAMASTAKAAPAPRDTAAARLDRLEAKDACQSVLFDYARGNDRLDADLLRGCFWPESQHQHGGFKGNSIDFVNFALKILAGVKYTAHHISNVAIEVQGDRAFSECYYFAHHRRDAKTGGGEEDAFFEGRYIDRFERRGAVWKIIQRRGLADFTQVVAATTPFASWPAGQHSERFPTDDYYAMRRAFRGG